MTSTRSPRISPITARSSDQVVLQGDVQGEAASAEILFIHGLRQSRLCWDKQFADPALSTFRLARFDLRGHGDSDKPTALDAYSELDRWADDIAAVISTAKLRRPVLVGWSLGAFMVGAYLRKYGAAQVAGINLVAPVIKRSLELFGPDAKSFTRTTSSHDLAERVVGTADFLAACFHIPPSPEEFQHMLVINGMATRSVMEGTRLDPVKDMTPVFQAYQGPLLFTHGVHDRIVSVSMSEQVTALRPDAKLSLFLESGHSPFYEEPSRFGRELAAFTSGAPTQHNKEPRENSTQQKDRIGNA